MDHINHILVGLSYSEDKKPLCKVIPIYWARMASEILKEVNCLDCVKSYRLYRTHFEPHDDGLCSYIIEKEIELQKLTDFSNQMKDILELG